MGYDDLFVSEAPKRLSNKEALVLFNRMKQGDMKAREEIINHNIKLVIYCVRSKFRSVDYDNKELVSIGCIGLIKAVDTYDISKGNEFSSYAVKCIANEINTFFKSLKRNIRVLSFEDSVCSGEDGDDLKLKDAIPSEVDMERDYTEKESSMIKLNLLKQSMKCLDERSKKIVMLYFGFFDDKTYAMQKIADMMNMSKPQISRIINGSLKKIREYMQLLELGVDIEKTNNKNKVKTIYEYLSDYTKEEIDEVIGKLLDKDRELLRLKYGDDLDNPVLIVSDKQQAKLDYNFYNLIRKIKRLLVKARNSREIIEDSQDMGKAVDIVSSNTLKRSRNK